MSAADAGRALRVVRTTMGVTQLGAAERAGISRYTLGRLERGQVACSGDPQYGRVARMYGQWLAEMSQA